VLHNCTSLPQFKRASFPITFQISVCEICLCARENIRWVSLVQSLSMMLGVRVVDGRREKCEVVMEWN